MGTIEMRGKMCDEPVGVIAECVIVGSAIVRYVSIVHDCNGI
jgi:hypothetical protein